MQESWRCTVEIQYLARRARRLVDNAETPIACIASECGPSRNMTADVKRLGLASRRNVTTPCPPKIAKN